MTPPAHGHGPGHGHVDDVDWASALDRLRASDELHRDAHAALARRLLVPGVRTVIDVGAGAGGMGAAFAEAMAGGEGAVVLVDTAPELLQAAQRHAAAAAGPGVEVRAVQADAGTPALLDLVPRGDLVFTSFVVHHLPDQQAGLARLARLVRGGGRLAVVEPGLEPRCLPWDLGVGDAGLDDRLTVARSAWLSGMRASMDGSVRLPIGWNLALAEAGLVDVTAFSYLVDLPAPPSAAVRAAALQRLAGMRERAGPWIDPADLDTLGQLLDPESAHYAGRREDVFWLAANTVHLGTVPRDDAGA